MMTRRTFRFPAMMTLTLPALLPTACNQVPLKELTPYVIDGSNRGMVDLIFGAAPLVL